MSKDWTGNSNLYITNHRSKESEVAENDLYCTHPDSIKLFLEKLKSRNITLPKNIWEPCCGLGSISEVLKEYGYNVKSSDLIDRGYGIGNIDFLKITKDKLSNEFKNLFLDCIFTNPPYKYAVEICEKALELINENGFVIMFMKLTFLESKKRLSLFNKHKLKYVFVYSERQGCGKNTTVFENGGAAAYAMYIWKNDYNGLPEIDWI